MGQRPQVGHAAWLGAAAVVAALVTGCGGGHSDAVTRLTQTVNAQVLTAAGQTLAARPGLTLHPGDEVRTGVGGAAVFATGTRKAYLGGQGSYLVQGRTAGTLRRGALVVDGRSGPALDVTSGPVTARVIHSAARLEHGFAVRVGVLAGKAVAVTGDAAGGPARTTVPSLYQVVVAGRGLADPTALALTDDDAERLVAPDLVADDVQLTRTAAALDTGAEGRAIVTVAVSRHLTNAKVTAQYSETALPMAMARSLTSNASALGRDYNLAANYRREGGSWGVVARLVGTDATQTSRAIDALLIGVPTAGTILAAAPAPAPGSASSPSSRSPGQVTNPGGVGDRKTPPPTGGKPTTKPTPSPSPTPGPIQQVVGGVLGTLPPVTGASTSPKPCKLLGLLNC
ncbi:MAG: hypothetical protein ACJ735_09160 [Actinomycetes bacterium]